MEIERELQEAVMEALDLSEEISDEELLERIDRVLVRQSKQRFLSVGQRAACRKQIFDSFRRLDILQELVEDDSITEIMVNGTQAVFLERSGTICCWNRRFSSSKKLEDVIQQIVARVNRVVNTSSPIVDARLEDGSRVHAVLPPVAPDGPILTIRKFPKEPITMEQLLAWGSLSEAAARFLQNLVEAKYNLFVSGGTGSGKTTFLNALSQFIPKTERVITIEDSAELQLHGIANLVRLEARCANLEGENEVSIRDLIRASLRMRPDRIIVGEVRGPEALDMLQAMNTGHDGSLSTGHGNSPRDMISRLETMILMGGELPLSAVRGQIASALDIMVHLGRMRDGSRKVLEIVEVMEGEGGNVSWNPLFSYSREKGRLEDVGKIRNKQKLEAAGLSEL
ncbi:CpaF family protein [Hominifimenecus sp. rT4P-3]|uniref:CpaF family protein n=1 Tax=Hominifimenecus sp. rT4P-3 TaxID=3242979 RepID=UPI003DA5322C